jgi:hypothetical protein
LGPFVFLYIPHLSFQLKYPVHSRSLAFRSLSIKAMPSSTTSSSSPSTPHAGRKGWKNPDLALDLSNEALSNEVRGVLLSCIVRVDNIPAQICQAHQPLFSNDSRSHTPQLVPDTEDDTSECGNDSDVQYVYIFDDTPFFREPLPSSSSYMSFSGFPFACDALVQDDPLFARAPGSVFEDELDLDSLSPLNDERERIMAAEDASKGGVDPWQSLEWSSTTGDDSVSWEQIKSAPMVLQTGNTV